MARPGLPPSLNVLAISGGTFFAALYRKSYKMQNFSFSTSSMCMNFNSNVVFNMPSNVLAKMLAFYSEKERCAENFIPKKHSFTQKIFKEQSLHALYVQCTASLVPLFSVSLQLPHAPFYLCGQRCLCTDYPCFKDINRSYQIKQHIHPKAGLIFSTKSKFMVEPPPTNHLLFLFLLNQ